MMAGELSFILAVFLAADTFAAGEDRDTKVRKDRQSVLEGAFWIYNDLPKGLAEARRMGKPLLVVLRCIP